MTRYGFRRALSAMFLADIDALAAELPPGLWPLEGHAHRGVLALTAFDFDDSEVGAYAELVVSILVDPWAPRGAQLPDAAYFPIFLATDTPRSRAHAAQRWRLPEHASCLDICFGIGADRWTVSARDGDHELLRLSTEAGPMGDSARTYQCFSTDTAGLHRVGIEIRGPLAEHEDESGELSLGAHPLAARWRGWLDELVPLREQTMGAGEQRFGSLTLHNPARSEP